MKSEKNLKKTFSLDDYNSNNLDSSASFIKGDSLPSKTPISLKQSKYKYYINKLLISHNSKWKSIFDFISLIILNISSWILLYKITFYPTYSYYYDDFWFDINPYTELWFFIYIILNFFQKYKNNETGEIVASYRKIAFKYLTSWFIVDAVSFVPYNLVCIFNFPHKFYFIYKLIRLIRLPKLWQIISLESLDHMIQVIILTKSTKKYDYYKRIKFFIKLGRLFIIGFLFAYWLACLWYWICSVINNHEQGATFIKIYHMEMKPPFDKLVLSFYFIWTILTTNGFGDVDAVSLREEIVTIFWMVICIAVYSYFMGSLSDSADEAVLMGHEQTNCQKLLIDLSKNLSNFHIKETKKIDNKMVSKINQMIKYYHQNDKNFFLDCEKYELITSIPSYWQREIFKTYYSDFYERFSTFFLYYGQNVHQYFNIYYALSFHIYPRYYCKHETIYKSSEPVSEVLFINYGNVRVLNKNGYVIRNKKSKDIIGTYFCFFTVKNNHEYIARNNCHLKGVKHKNWIKYLSKYPDLFEKIKNEVLKKYQQEKMFEKKVIGDNINTRYTINNNTCANNTMIRRIQTKGVNSRINDKVKMNRKMILSLEDNDGFNCMKIIHLNHLELEKQISEGFKLK